LGCIHNLASNIFCCIYSPLDLFIYSLLFRFRTKHKSFNLGVVILSITGQQGKYCFKGYLCNVWVSLSLSIYIYYCQNILLCNKMIQNKYRYTYVKGNLSLNNDKHFCTDIGRLQKVNSLASCGVLFLSPSLSL